MCGRFTLTTPPDLLAARFGLPEVPDLKPRFNMAPSQLIPVVGSKPDGRRGLSLFKWGFIPHWAQADDGPKPVNAKAETVAGSVAFGESLRRRRCLVPASGFYEWRTVKRKKYPVHFHRKDGQPFAFAGLWDVWNGPRGKEYTCCIITTTPNELTAPVHDRMPVILAQAAEGVWLDPAVHEPEDLLALLVPYPAADMAADPANPVVNKAGFDGPAALVPPPSELFP